MRLPDLMNALQSNKADLGEFSLGSERVQLLNRLASICPGWIQFREVAGKQAVKLDLKISAYNVQRMIVDRLGTGISPTQQ